MQEAFNYAAFGTYYNPNVGYYNLAHVLPQNLIKANVENAMKGWSVDKAKGYPMRKRFKDFINWLFKVDDEAYVWRIHDAKPKAEKFTDYMARNKKMLSKKNTEYLGYAINIIYDGVKKTYKNWGTDKELLEYILVNAPANLRYGSQLTNGQVNCQIDPMGDWDGFPTKKECEMLNSEDDLSIEYKDPPGDKGTWYLLPKDGQFFSSNGYNKLGGDQKDWWETWLYSEGPDQWTDPKWDTCFNKKKVDFLPL